MKLRWLPPALLITLAGACQDAPEPAAPSLSPADAPRASLIDPALSDALVTADDDEQLEIIVNYDETLTSLDALTNTVLDLGAGVIQFRHLSMLAALATPAQITAIAALPGLQTLTLNSELQWHNREGRASVNADQVHAAGITGEGIGIAILDSGIDGGHADVRYPSKTKANVKYVANVRDVYYFEGRINGTIRKGAALWVEDVENSETSIGHGTHVAATAAGGGEASDGKYRGVAPGADLIGIGTGDVLFIFWVLAGFDYLLEHRVEHNIQVVNNSWGSSGFGFDAEHPINEATREVHDAGVTVVFSAGNCGTEEDGECSDSGQYQLNPYSAAPWVISVAAGCKTVEDDPTISSVHCPDDGRGHLLADFSSRGIPGDPLHHPDITAPGVHVVSARASTGTVMTGLDAPHDLDLTSTCAISEDHLADYTCASGTSMASPHVAGIVALMQEAAGGTLTPDEVLEILTSTARPLDDWALWEVGEGYADALAAVEAARR